MHHVSSALQHVGCFFFFNDTATTEIYTLSLHDALPISAREREGLRAPDPQRPRWRDHPRLARSEEHTSELQSPCNLVCRLLLEKKKIGTPVFRSTMSWRPSSGTSPLL